MTNLLKHLFLAAPETRISEGVNLAAFAWWTILLMLPAHLFASQPAFRELAAHGSEHHWGVWTLAATVAVLIGLITRRPVWRVLGMAGAAGLWLFVAGLLAEGAQGLPLLGFLLPKNTGVGVYGTLGGASVVCAWRLYPYLFADVAMLIGFTLARKSIPSSVEESISSSVGTQKLSSSDTGEGTPLPPNSNRPL